MEAIAQIVHHAQYDAYLDRCNDQSGFDDLGLPGATDLEFENIRAVQAKQSKREDIFAETLTWLLEEAINVT